MLAFLHNVVGSGAIIAYSYVKPQYRRLIVKTCGCLISISNIYAVDVCIFKAGK